MVDAACYVLSASDWHQLLSALARFALLFPMFVWLISIDWWRLEDRIRSLLRRRRLRAIREVRCNG